MDFQHKVERLSQEPEFAMYRWSVGSRRIAPGLVSLSDLRLSAIWFCSAGRLSFASAAPVLRVSGGIPRVTYGTEGILTVSDGQRKGLNILAGQLRRDEHAVPARRCVRMSLKPDGRYPRWVESKVLSMGQSLIYPCARLITPDVFRLTRNADSLEPTVSAEMLRQLSLGGGETGDIHTRFMRLISSSDAGFRQPFGYLVPFDSVCRGGCCVVREDGMSTRAGSIVHWMSLDDFIRDAGALGLDFKENEDEVERSV